MIKHMISMNNENWNNFVQRTEEGRLPKEALDYYSKWRRDPA